MRNHYFYYKNIFFLSLIEKVSLLTRETDTDSNVASEDAPLEVASSITRSPILGRSTLSSSLSLY